jgi:hypothetical protein
MYYMARVNITTSISSDDHAYVKKRGLKWSKLLESAIAVDRVAFDNGEDGDGIKVMKRKMDIAIERMNKGLHFIESKGLMVDFIEHNANN